MNPITREFTVATFVVHQKQILLLWHRKLSMWLPPGGHIDAGELPDEAAVREVKEETGLDCQLVGEAGLPVEYPRQLIRPAGIQLETIVPNEHEHIDLIYFARLTDESATCPQSNQEVEKVGWYTLAQMRELDVAEDAFRWAELAVRSVEG